MTHAGADAAQADPRAGRLRPGAICFRAPPCARPSDGTLIPISLVSERRVARDGSAPLLLQGYGSYGLSYPVGFSSNRVSLLDRGVTVAIAHIRGGGEMGEDWREAGKMHQKRTTFTDFIACAEHLVAEEVYVPGAPCHPGRQRRRPADGRGRQPAPRPVPCRAVPSPFRGCPEHDAGRHPAADRGEYLEWGNPNVPADYEYMKTYCPYTNIAAQAYPAMLVKTSLNDSQVMYWEAAKYVAKLRALKTGDHLLLLKTNMGAGHGGSSGRYDALRETAFDYAFLLNALQ